MARRRTARDRIRQVIDKWLMVEPLFLSVWTMHHLVVNPSIGSLRVGRGRIEYNPAFIDALDAFQLEAVLDFEAMRLVLRHPYARRKPHAGLSYLASNITLQEYLDTELPVPRAREVFGSREWDLQYFELYYVKLLEASDDTLAAAGIGAGQLPGTGGTPEGDDEEDDGGDTGETPEGGDEEGDGEEGGGAGGEEGGGAAGGEGDEEGGGAGGGGTSEASGPLDAHAQPSAAGEENTELWDADELFAGAIDDKIQTADETGAWGTVAGRHRELILAALRPKLDYRAVLRQFRASVLSIHRRLTRMKPNRRYGFLYMGSRYDFTTKLLVAIDVSGSMGSEELAQVFSVVNRFFKYGVQSIDVIQFDTKVQGPVQSFKRARRRIEVTGRGGTSFAPVIGYLDQHPGYDGLIIFTDGYAPVPPPPRNRYTRVLWLFTHERTYRAMHDGLRAIGKAAFLRAG